MNFALILALIPCVVSANAPMSISQRFNLGDAMMKKVKPQVRDRAAAARWLTSQTFWYVRTSDAGSIRSIAAHFTRIANNTTSNLQGNLEHYRLREWHERGIGLWPARQLLRWPELRHPQGKRNRHPHYLPDAAGSEQVQQELMCIISSQGCVSHIILHVMLCFLFFHSCI